MRVLWTSVRDAFKPMLNVKHVWLLMSKGCCVPVFSLYCCCLSIHHKHPLFSAQSSSPLVWFCFLSLLSLDHHHPFPLTCPSFLLLIIFCFISFFFFACADVLNNNQKTFIFKNGPYVPLSFDYCRYTHGRTVAPCSCSPLSFPSPYRWRCCCGWH